MDQNGNGTFDFPGAGRSDLDPSLPAEATTNPARRRYETPMAFVVVAAHVAAAPRSLVAWQPNSTSVCWTR